MMVIPLHFLRCLIAVSVMLATLGIESAAAAEPAAVPSPSANAAPEAAPVAAAPPVDPVLHAKEEAPEQDRFWLISTRHLRLDACCADLDSPELGVSRLGMRGRHARVELEEYLAARRSDRPVVIYVHGNRMEYCDAIARGLFVYRQVARQRCDAGPIDWVIWSWPSAQEGILLHDVREKASRTDTQGLFLAWLLRQHVRRDQPTALIGYSFGGRVVSGALHAMAGGPLGGRRLPGEAVTGAGFEVGMVAPAMENDWMSERGYHRLATKNLDRLVLLYNQQDTILKNYWRLPGIRNADALGYSGPTSFARRVDGSPVPVAARDCSNAVGRNHSEIDYYNKECGAGAAMASLIHGCLVHNECSNAGH